MKKTNKLYALILAGALCLSLAACGGDTSTTPDDADTDSAGETEQESVQTEDAGEETARSDDTGDKSPAKQPTIENVKADADTMRTLFSECVGFGDTSDPAVKEAEAVYNLVSCAQALQVAGLDEDATAELRQAIYDGYQGLDEVQRAEFDTNFAESLNSLANDAVEDYQSVEDLFEAAGLNDEMAALVSQDNVVANWTTFGAYIVTRNAGNTAVSDDADSADADTDTDTDANTDTDTANTGADSGADADSGDAAA